MNASTRTEPVLPRDRRDRSAGSTRSRALLDWIEVADPTRGLRTLDADRSWQFHSYENLAAKSLAVADRLRASGVRPGDVVTLVLGSGVEFIASFFGVLAAGATASPVAPPLVFQDAAVYNHHLHRVLDIAKPRTVVTSPDLAPRFEAPDLTEVVPSITVITGDAFSGSSANAGLHGKIDRAILQFTSGSSGAAKGVAISGEALTANVTAIRHWLEMTKDDPTATWLPVYHDMGLIGCLITPVVNGSDLWIMQPEDFVRAPARWLACFGQEGARLTALPNFGLEHVVRRVRPEALDGFDFSDWRVAILGAERIHIDAMRAFYDLLATHGFRWETFLPAYGLAEATLAVTGLPVRRGARSVFVDRETLRLGERVTIEQESDLGTATLALVGCGRPLEREEVRVVDAEGREVGDQMLGEIVVTSPSLADGYYDDGLVLGTGFDEGQLTTGDAGFIVGDELFVVGRLGDSVKVRGRTVFAEDLEEVAVRAAGLKSGRLVVLLGSLEGRDTIVAIAETTPGDWVDRSIAALSRHSEDLPIVVSCGPRGCILRTSSGKPRRRLMWEGFATGLLGVGVVRDTCMIAGNPTPNS